MDPQRLRELAAQEPDVQRLVRMHQLATSEEEKNRVADRLIAIRPEVEARVTAREEMGSGRAAAIGAASELVRLGEGARMLFGDEEKRREAEESRAEREQMVRPVKQAFPVATAIGEMTPGLAVPGGAGTTLFRRGLGAGLSAGGYEGLASGGDPTSAALGATFGAAGSEASRLAGRYLGGDPEVLARNRVRTEAVGAEHPRLVQEAEQMGMALTPAQRSGNQTLGDWEASLASEPWTAGPFHRIAEQNQNLANRTARESIGLPGDDLLTDDVLIARNQDLSDEYTRLVGEDKSFPISPEFAELVQGASAEYMRGLTRSPKTRRMLNNLVELSEDQYMTVKDYQQISSDLARVARSVGPEDPASARALLASREALDVEFDEAFGDLEELREVRRQWRNAKQIAESRAIDRGEFRPTVFRNYLRQKKQGAGIVRGNRPIDRLSILESHFRTRTPNSGTTTRQAARQARQADWVERILMAMGGEYTNAYLQNPGLVAGPGAFGAIPPAVVPLLGPSQIIGQRLGRQYGVEEAQGEGLLGF